MSSPPLDEGDVPSTRPQRHPRNLSVETIDTSSLAGRRSPRPRCGSVSTIATIPENEIMSPTSAGRPSSQFRLRRAPTASKDYKIQSAGLDPGLDPEVGPISSEYESLHTECQITVVEFNEEQIVQQDFFNEGLKEFLEKPREDWVKVRWINCNGLSWDIIQLLTRHYNFHSLALEDLLAKHDNNRPKCDWYSDHAFVILPLLKLLDGTAPDFAHQGDPSFPQNIPLWKKLLFGVRQPKRKPDPECAQPTTPNFDNSRNRVRTLQSAYGGPNSERIAYMEAHSSLTPLDKIVHVEQVSIFLTCEGTVVSFFEISGDDIEPPILARLNSDKTLLRTSSDPSMMLQAIIDGIVDLSFPVVSAYQDTIAELELNVLTDPNVEQSQNLYILTSELSLLKSTIAPIAAVVTSLRDHRKTLLSLSAKRPNGVEVSDMTRTYLNDVLDHVLLILDNLETMKRAADNMIDLIFNTIGSLQNETMKQLTTITIFFLPLTFLAGYFGMNFAVFPGVQENSDLYFWKIGIPLVVVTLAYCLREVVGKQVVKKFQRRAIKVAGRRRREKGGAKGKND
ncbi:Similar to Magnesium transport protein CorA; acc. no. Q9WZ31 [Pyronema omphalodes CBS 100304]|uniref:Similar to Magnesium transport protein CorA acc. no. Q9WZ31 n=1 Tax=Pyronema omphalodes (strain CBS 100304) TaxID=1076935 RepID=U4LTY8_PYROM|nr:Similar to Magnesium transport protein CorA; acc. no. Q9WZ31 [Pyronema omphalodes CBS 100304]